MGVFSFLNFGSSNIVMPTLYPIPIEELNFVSIDVETIFSRILMDVLERTEGVPEDKVKLLWDSCVKSASQDGLITLVAKAMTEKADLYLVYAKDVDLIRKADSAEQAQIEADYRLKNKSTVGFFITFKNMTLTEMIKFYSAIEYCTVGGLYKAQNLSNAIQIRVSMLRASLGNSDSERAIADGALIATGLKEGKSVLMDKDDVIDTAKPDLTATTSTMEFISKKKSFYLGLPTAWVEGVQKTGMSGTGDADAKAIDRGLKPYFYKIIKPIIDSIFTINVEFKPEDNDDIATANETLKAFEVTSSQFINDENKTKILNKLYALPEDSKGDGPPEVDPNAIPGGPNAIPGKNPSAPTGKKTEPPPQK